MRAIAHGWKPSRMESPPSRAVAQEFMEADRKYSGGFAENRYYTGGLAAMSEVNSGIPETLNWASGGYAEGGKYGTEPLTLDQVMELGGRSGPGMAATWFEFQKLGWQQDPNTKLFYPPQQTIAGDEPATYDPYYGVEAPVEAYNRGPRRGGRRGGGGRGGRDGGGGSGGGGAGGGGPGGPSTPPPRIIPSTPPIAAGPLPLDKESEFRDQLRAHRARIKSILDTGNAEGGPVNYYQEGGAARPGHAEGPNPYEGDPLLKKSYARWEKKHHMDPPPPPPPEAAAAPEEVPWWKKLMGYEAGPTQTDEALEAIGQAYGGRVGYQVGGLAIAAPRGGIPPWAEPVGDPVQEYQFGGAASRFGGARGRMPYRGVPPQRGGIQRGAPPGGGRGFLNRFGRQAQAQRGAPQGGLAAMMGQAQQQQAGGLPPGIDPRAVAADPQGWAQQQMEQARAGMGGPGGGGSVGLSPYEEMENQRRGPRGPLGPGGSRGPLQLPGRGGGYGRTPYGRPGKQLPGQRIAPPPGKFPRGRVQPGGPGGPVPGGGGFDPGAGGIPGGARVPPNLQGYLQRMRMQNRPPSGPGGGGANRIGMQDQQGAMARGLQRGTGRPPMSRRMAFGRGAQQ